MISQLTVFFENERGRLASAARTLADAGINLHALFIADTEDFGVARIFCDRPEHAAATLKEAGYRAATTPVIGVRVPDEKGGLATLLEFLDEQEVNIEYDYCYCVNGGYAINVLKVVDEGVEDQLRAAGFDVVAPGDIYALD